MESDAESWASDNVGVRRGVRLPRRIMYSDSTDRPTDRPTGDSHLCLLLLLLALLKKNVECKSSIDPPTTHTHYFALPQSRSLLIPWK